MIGTERLAVERHVTELARFTNLEEPFVYRDKTLTNEQGHAAMIAGLLTRKGTRLDTATSEQLTEEYLDAIEELPAWCVREALRKWNRGESARLDNKPHDFNWRPEPGILARLARLELYVVKGRIRTMERLLEAEPLPEYSEQHQRDMRAQLRALPFIGGIIQEEKRP